jgi:hypothetical protein
MPLTLKWKSMKTLFLFLLTAIFTVSLDAQTKGTMIFGTAQNKYQKMERTGTVLTAIGGVALFTGNILYWKAYNDRNNEIPESKTKAYRGIMIGGIGLMAVGIPLLTIGKTKLRHIEIQARLVQFKGLASANGLGLRVRF